LFLPTPDCGKHYEDFQSGAESKHRKAARSSLRVIGVPEKQSFTGRIKSPSWPRVYIFNIR
jgi:hypothetical protein